LDGVEKSLPSKEELEKEENLDALSQEQLDTFRRRAVHEPGGVLREGVPLTNDARLDLPVRSSAPGTPRTSTRTR
jgi:hypothetical protein